MELPKNLGLKRCRYGNMLYRTNDKYVGRSLDLYGEFSNGESTLFESLITKEMTVIDAGANIGAHTVQFSNLARHVLAIEAQMHIFQMLNANIALNDLRNVSTLRAAIGETIGKIIIPGINFDAGGNFGCISAIGHTNGNSIPLVSIDSFNLRACDFMKIDVEGMEQQAIAGALQTIRQYNPIIYIENDRKENSSKLIEMLQEEGYDMYWHIPPLYNILNFFDNKENVFPDIYSFNMLCVPAGYDVHADQDFKVRGPDDWWNRLLTKGKTA